MNLPDEEVAISLRDVPAYIESILRERDEARARVAEVEAQAAAMRKELHAMICRWSDRIRELPEGDQHWYHQGLDNAVTALSGDAGRALLKRVARMEKALR